MKHTSKAFEGFSLLDVAEAEISQRPKWLWTKDGGMYVAHGHRRYLDITFQHGTDNNWVWSVSDGLRCLHSGRERTRRDARLQCEVWARNSI